MASITTRALSGDDSFDIIPIKIDPETYAGKWGIIEVVISSYTWGSGSPTAADAGEVDIRNAQFAENIDTPMWNHVHLALTAGTVTSTKKYYFAVNNGVIGPGAFIEPDGSWDLINLQYKQPAANTLALTTVTVNYSVNFTDLTPAFTPGSTGTVDLHVDNFKIFDTALIQDVAGTYGSSNGRVLVQIVGISSLVKDIPDDDEVPPGLTPTQNDSVPLLTITSMPADGSFGTFVKLFEKPNTKRTGVRTLSKTLMIFAVNSGLIDGNGQMAKGNAAAYNFMNVTLQKLVGWPCDDIVDCTVSYAITFTAM